MEWFSNVRTKIKYRCRSLLSKIAETAWKPTRFDAAFGQAMMDFQDRASWCCPRSSEGQKGLRVILLMGRRGERFVEPGHQIAMGE